MTAATATGLNDDQARVLNVLHDMIAASGATGVQYGRLAFRADFDRWQALTVLANRRLIRVVDNHSDGAELDLMTASEAAIINSRVYLTTAGQGWVEDNPRNALLRAVNASPLGRVTLRRAMQVADDMWIIRRLVADGYVTAHHADGRVELRKLEFMAASMRGDPDAYILLPTPKIRKVLGS